MYDEVTIKASSATPKREKTMQWGTEIKKKFPSTTSKPEKRKVLVDFLCHFERLLTPHH